MLQKEMEDMLGGRATASPVHRWDQLELPSPPRPTAAAAPRRLLSPSPPGGPASPWQGGGGRDELVSRSTRNFEAHERDELVSSPGQGDDQTGQFRQAGAEARRQARETSWFRQAQARAELLSPLTLLSRRERAVRRSPSRSPLRRALPAREG